VRKIPNNLEMFLRVLNDQWKLKMHVTWNNFKILHHRELIAQLFAMLQVHVKTDPFWRLLTDYDKKDMLLIELDEGNLEKRMREVEVPSDIRYDADEIIKRNLIYFEIKLPNVKRDKIIADLEKLLYSFENEGTQIGIFVLIGKASDMITLDNDDKIKKMRAKLHKHNYFELRGYAKLNTSNEKWGLYRESKPYF